MIHYQTVGSGPAIVLVHGFPNDSSTWQALVPSFSDRYKVLLPDLPGAGGSAPLPGELTIARMADALMEMMDHEKVDQAILVGHSMGGYTVVELAASYPERLSGLALVHSLASADSEEKIINREKAIRLMSKGTAEAETFLRGMAQNLFAESFAEQHPETVRSVVQQGMKISPEHLAAFYTAIKNRVDRQDVLRQASFPIQWIIGTEDAATPATEALKQAHLAPINHVAVYQNCGHMSMLEAPDALSADLQAFFAYCINY